MKASNFLEAQNAFITKRGVDGTRVSEIFCMAGILQATSFCQKKQYAWSLLTETKRVDHKNSRLTSINADPTLDGRVLR